MHRHARQGVLGDRASDLHVEVTVRRGERQYLARRVLDHDGRGVALDGLDHRAAREVDGVVRGLGERRLVEADCRESAEIDPRGDAQLAGRSPVHGAGLMTARRTHRAAGEGGNCEGGRTAERRNSWDPSVSETRHCRYRPFGCLGIRSCLEQHSIVMAGRDVMPRRRATLRLATCTTLRAGSGAFGEYGACRAVMQTRP